LSFIIRTRRFARFRFLQLLALLLKILQPYETDSTVLFLSQSSILPEETVSGRLAFSVSLMILFASLVALLDEGVLATPLPCYLT